MIIGSECRPSVGWHGGGELLLICSAGICFALAVGLAFLVGGSSCLELWPKRVLRGACDSMPRW